MRNLYCCLIVLFIIAKKIYMQPKKKVVISIENAPKPVLEAIAKKYPDGWQNFVIKIEKCPDNFFHAITVDLEDSSYLIKVPVKIDTKIEEEIEKDNYSFLADTDTDAEADVEGESGNEGDVNEVETNEDK